MTGGYVRRQPCLRRAKNITRLDRTPRLMSVCCLDATPADQVTQTPIVALTPGREASRGRAPGIRPDGRSVLGAAEHTWARAGLPACC